MQSASESNHEQQFSQSEKPSLGQNPPQTVNHIQEVEENKVNYYNEFCRLYLANTILTTQLKQLVIEKAELLTKLTRLERRADQLSEGGNGQVDQKKRRIRRAASEIARHYKCHVDICNKSYGSEGSLNQHIKIKHPIVYKGMGFVGSNNPTVKQESDEDQEDDESLI